MHRLTARLLLLFALAGNLVPLALAATAAPPHACCVRKAVHRCHESVVMDSPQLVLRDTGCCNHDCCHAVTTPQWANAQNPANIGDTQNSGAHFDQPLPVFLNTEALEIHSSRAPPPHRF